MTIDKGAEQFMCFDLTDAYSQIKVAEESQHLLMFMAPLGKADTTAVTTSISEQEVLAGILKAILTTRQPDNWTARQQDIQTNRQMDNWTTRQPNNPITRQQDNQTTGQPDNHKTRQPDN